MDASTFLGFYVSVFHNFVVIFFYYIFYLVAVLLHIGFCTYLDAFVEDYSHMMQSIDDESIGNFMYSRVQRHDNRLKSRLIGAVEMHAKITRFETKKRAVFISKVPQNIQIFCLSIPQNDGLFETIIRRYVVYNVGDLCTVFNIWHAFNR